jgi:hypothetical protein
MTPELNEDEMRLLHKEAMELYELYFKNDAKHKIGVGEHIAKEICSSKNTNFILWSIVPTTLFVIPMLDFFIEISQFF